MQELTIGQRIAACRKNLGLSQEALGEKLGISRQAISKWEADAAMPEIDKLIGLSKLYNVSVGWLLGVEEQSAPAEPPEISPELLHKIEEIVLRYRPRKQPLSTKKKVLLGALAAVVLWCGFSFAGKWSRLTLDVATTGNQVRTNNEQNARIMDQIAALEARLNEPKDTLLSHYQFRVVPIHIDSTVDTSDAEIHFSAVPIRWAEGDTGILSIRHPDKGTLQADCDWDGSFLTAMLPLGEDNGYELCFTIRHADGTQEQQMLEDSSVENLRSYLSIPLTASRGVGRFKLDGTDLKLTLQDYSVYVDRPAIAQPEDTWDSIEYVLQLHRGGEQQIVGTYDTLGSAGEDDNIRYASRIAAYGDSAVFVLPGAHEGDGLVLWLKVKMSNGMEGSTIVDQWRYSGGAFENAGSSCEYD